VEASLEADLGGGLVVRGSWTRVDARYRSFEVDGSDFSGHRIPGLAPHRVFARASQERERWFWAIESTWTAEVPVDDAGSGSAAAHRLLDLRAGLTRMRLGGIELAPFAGLSNVLDEDYVAGVTVNAFGGRYYEPGPGRTAHLGATLSWHDRP
jgi:iron complex outermembrane receptor protein